MRVNQLLKPSAVDTSAFNDLPPRHKEVVNDFYNQVDYDNKDVVKEVEKTVEAFAMKKTVAKTQTPVQAVKKANEYAMNQEGSR